MFCIGVLACSGSLSKDDAVAVFIVGEKPEQGSSTLLRGTILSHQAPMLSELCIGELLLTVKASLQCCKPYEHQLLCVKL